ncbi:MAG: hypothetical protein J3K34DRAFT_456314 [Monoraphidium minutum]|nr:MAG: hypothetical protein J3K34DRAFT_456314 [Monoraphidium minutum]
MLALHTAPKMIKASGLLRTGAAPAARNPRAAPHTAGARAAPLAPARAGRDDSVTFSFTDAPAANGNGAPAPPPPAVEAPPAPTPASATAAAEAAEAPAPAAAPPRPEDFVWADEPSQAAAAGVPPGPGASSAGDEGGFAARVAAGTEAGAAARVAAAKLALLERVSGLDRRAARRGRGQPKRRGAAERGALASVYDKSDVEALVSELEAAGRAAAVAGGGGGGGAASLEGRWELLYSNVEAFRNSPFFGAFSNVVDGLASAAGPAGAAATGGAAADAIFAFTDAIPGARVGPAFQIITSDSLVSEVDLFVFPGLRGTVVTTSRIDWAPAGVAGVAAGPVTLDLSVESTRVERSNFSPLLDSIAVPVERLIEGVQGPAAARVTYEITFFDAGLRVTRAGRQTMVHRRA